MQQVARGNASSGLRSRHASARTDAFARRSATREQGGYQTPAWLERSFVLPVDGPGDATRDDVPAQPRADHDVLRPAPDFVRPPSEEVDFARVVARGDACRRARSTALLALAVALLSLGLYLLTSSAAALGVVAAGFVAGTGAALVVVRLQRAPVPHVPPTS